MIEGEGQTEFVKPTEKYNEHTAKINKATTQAGKVWPMFPKYWCEETKAKPVPGEWAKGDSMMWRSSDPHRGPAVKKLRIIFFTTFARSNDKDTNAQKLITNALWTREMSMGIAEHQRGVVAARMNNDLVNALFER